MVFAILQLKILKGISITSIFFWTYPNIWTQMQWNFLWIDLEKNGM